MNMDLTYDERCPVCNPNQPKSPKVVRMSLSLPSSLVKYAKQRAKELDVPVSHIIRDAIIHYRHMNGE